MSVKYFNIEELIYNLERYNTPIKDLRYAEEQIHRFLPDPQYDYWSMPRIDEDDD